MFSLVLSVVLLSSVPVEPPILNVQEARNILTTTTPHPFYSMDVLLLPHNSENKEVMGRAKLYQTQMEAIKVLISTKDPGDLQILIPFLGYFNDPNVALMGSSHLITLEESVKQYPIFAALLANPEAAPMLENYCLDEKNGPDSRITAFFALKSVNPTNFKRISSKFNGQWNSADATIQSLLSSIENGPGIFNGEIDANSIRNSQ